MSNQINGLRNSEEKGYTPVSSLDGIHERLLKTFYSGKTKDVKWRKDQLKSLAYMIQDNTQALTGELLYPHMSSSIMRSTLQVISDCAQIVALILLTLMLMLMMTVVLRHCIY